MPTISRTAPASSRTPARMVGSGDWVGAAAGAAAGGAIAEQAGPTIALALAGGAGAVATVVAALRAGTVGDPAALPQPAVA